MNIKITQINEENKSNINNTNRPFDIIGEIVPEFIEGKWKYQEKLYDTYTQKHYPNNEIKPDDYINNANRIIYFAYADNTCLGQLIMRRNWNNYCFIEDIAVDSKYRRCGIGQNLIDKAQEWADKNKLAGLMLETQNNNLIACKFYLKLGFEIGSVDRLLYSGLNNDEYAIFFYRKKAPLKKKIIVDSYNSKWNDYFIEVKNYLLPHLKNQIVSIEHVGSTSVAGLSAKPIIDIDISIKRENLINVISLLEQIGYSFVGDFGIADRYAFSRNDYITKHLPHHNLYLCPDDSREYIRHVRFRDYLRTDIEAVKQYSITKTEGAKLYPHNIQKYLKHKESFILSCYKKIFTGDINPVYRFNEQLSYSDIDRLCVKNGLDSIVEHYKAGLKNSYLYICCFIDKKLVGFVNVISNSVSDAYIQDLVVDTEYHNKGIGTMLMNLAIDKLKINNVHTISVLYDKKLIGFFSKFGFNLTYAGQLETKNHM